MHFACITRQCVCEASLLLSGLATGLNKKMTTDSEEPGWNQRSTLINILPTQRHQIKQLSSRCLFGTGFAATLKLKQLQVALKSQGRF